MKKSVVKQGGKKTVSRPKVRSHEFFVEITPDKYFVMCDGRQVKDYKELADILRIINDDMFYYHVNEQRNDFSTWISDVFNEEDLAQKIQGINNRMEMGLELYKHLFEKLDKKGKKSD